MDDIDFSYVLLDNIQSRYLSISGESEEEVINNMKILEYGLTVSGNTINIVPPANSAISQFEEVKLKVVVSGLSSNRCVILNISSPGFIQTEYDADDYQFRFHLLPSNEENNTYYLYLTAALRQQFNEDKVNVGTLQGCKYKFEIIDSYSNHYYQNSSGSDVISLYKTNIQYSYIPNDLDNVFIKLADLDDKISELE